MVMKRGIFRYEILGAKEERRLESLGFIDCDKN